MYLLKVAFRPWRRAWLSQFLGLLAFVFLLVTGVFLYSLHQGLSDLARQIDAKEVITVFLHPGTTAEAEEGLVDTIRTQVGAAPEIHSQEEFLQKMKAQDPRLSEELTALGGELKNLVPKFLTFEQSLPVAEMDRLKQMPSVDAVERSSHRFTNTVAALRAFRVLCLVLLGGVLTTLFVLTFQMVKVHQVFYQDFVQFLSQWGSRSWRLKSPMFVSVTSAGLLCSVVAAGIWLAIGPHVQSRIRNLSPAMGEIGFEMHSQQWLFLFGAGVGIAMAASLLSRARDA